MTFFKKTLGRVEFSPDHRRTLAVTMGGMYAQLSVYPLPTVLREFPEEFMDCARLVYVGAGASEPVFEGTFKQQELSFTSPVDETRVILAFSGGNDSVAAAIKFMEDGLTPVLFHVKGINTSYPNEAAVVDVCASKLGAELEVAYAKLHGGHGFKEPPTKDQLIMAMMVDLGLTRGIRKFGTGNESLNFAKDSHILYNWSDSVEMHMTSKAWYAAAMPGYEVLWAIKNRTHSLSIILGHDPELLNHTMSCILPYRFQKVRREGNQEKYGVKLRPNRCGSCYKCCAEYLNTVCMGVDEPNAEFIKHCFELFKSKMDIIYAPGYKHGADDVDILRDIVSEEFANPNIVLKYIGL